MPSWLDDVLKEAAARGAFTQPDKAGKPLPAEDDRHTPEHLRLAHKMLRDHDLAPDWMLQGQEVDAALQKLRAAVRRAVHAGLTAAAQTALEAQVAAYNRNALTYNLKAPPGVAHKPIVRLKDEIARV